MKFLAFPPTVALGLIAAVALIIILLHLLKPSPQRFVVASLLLWAGVRSARKHIDSRRLVLLLLALAAGLSLALALTQPQITALEPQRLVLILDNSWSMATRTSDGLTRWQHALDKARVLVEGTRAEDEVLLVDTAGRHSGAGFVDRDTALAALGELALPSWCNARIDPSARIDGAQIHLFTDGVARLEVPEQATVHSVFEPAENVAVTAFSTRPLLQDPTQYEALVQLLNASQVNLRARLLITGNNETGNDEFSITQDFELSAGETVNATFDVSDFNGIVLGAAVVSEHDALPADDLGFAVVPSHRPRRVLLVTSGNPPLKDALARLPGVQLGVVRPNDYSTSAGFDAVIFDRVAPDEAPTTGSLLFHPPARDWLANPAGVVFRPRVASWDENDAIVGGIAWRDLILSRATPLAVSENGSHGLVNLRSDAATALIASGSSPVRWVQVGFALEDSNFSFRPDFPVFLGKALDWIDAPTPVLTREPGYIEIALPGAKVYDGSGIAVAFAATSQGIVFEAASADVFTVDAPSGQIMVVVNASNPDYAQINRTVLPPANDSPIKRIDTGRTWNPELWVIMLLLAVVFLLLEWVAFTRPARD